MKIPPLWRRIGTAPLVRGINALHGGVLGAARAALDRGLLQQHRLEIPVISVGGIGFGGSGKTPVVAHLARMLAGQGAAVAVVTRSLARGTPHGPVRVPPHPGRGWCGRHRVLDEALLLARWLRDCAIYCGPDKTASARLAEAHGADLVLLDDGFQHLDLWRDLEIVTIPTGAAAHGPVRPWTARLRREGPDTLTRSQLVWCHRRGPDELPDPRATVHSRYRPTELVRWDGSRVGGVAQLQGRHVHLLCGIADPSGFVATVRGLGAEVVGQTLLPDHRLPPSGLVRRVAAGSRTMVLCSEKDLARLSGRPEEALVTALACELEVVSGDLDLAGALRDIVSSRETVS